MTNDVTMASDMESLNTRSNDSPQVYIIRQQTKVTQELARNSKHVTDLTTDVEIHVDQIEPEDSDGRVRAHIVEPVKGWISLKNHRFNFAEPKVEDLEMKSEMSEDPIVEKK